MKKAGIVIDKYKLPTFEKHLKAAGYTWEQHPGIVEGTWTLVVQTDDVQALAVVIAAANDESRSS